MACFMAIVTTNISGQVIAVQAIHSRFLAFHSASSAFHAVLPLRIQGFAYRCQQ